MAKRKPWRRCLKDLLEALERGPYAGSALFEEVVEQLLGADSVGEALSWAWSWQNDSQPFFAVFGYSAYPEDYASDPLVQEMLDYVEGDLGDAAHAATVTAADAAEAALRRCGYKV